MACAAAVKIVPDIFALGYTARTARWASVDETAKIWMPIFPTPGTVDSLRWDFHRENGRSGNGWMTPK